MRFGLACVLGVCIVLIEYVQAVPGVRSDKWITLTTIQLPTDAVNKMVALGEKGWKLCVVADTKTPEWPQLENVVFLSVADQAALGFETANHIPFENYGRKNLCYLYVIQHGAKVIFDTDDDNYVDDIALILDSERAITTLYTKNQSANAYAYFGHPQMWPRGYPLQHINNPNPMCFESTMAKPLVQQVLVNNDPDVDAIYRLTQKLGVTFDPHAVPMALPKGTFCPYNTQATIYHQEAFWGLLLPVTTTMRVCDIFRGYWVQRLLWEVDGQVAFLPAYVKQFRNPHKLIEDFIEEKQLYEEAQKFIDFLAGWKLPEHDIVKSMLSLSSDIEQAGFWGGEDIDLMAAWVKDLKNIGYEFPRIHSSSRTEIAKPVELTPKRWCKYPHIYAIIQFNRAEWYIPEIARMLQEAYAPMFGKVIFTGLMKDHVEGIPDDITWVDCDDDEGWGGRMYYCHARAMATYTPPPDGGYMVFGDDVIFNPCMLNRFNWSRLNFHPLEPFCDNLKEGCPDTHTAPLEGYAGWHWPAGIAGAAWKKSMRSLSPIYRQAIQEHLDWPGESDLPRKVIAVQNADFYYVPASYKVHFIALAHHFHVFRMHSEYALSSIMYILNKVGGGDQMDFWRVLYLWADDRDYIHQHMHIGVGFKYKQGELFALHPLKMASDKFLKDQPDMLVSDYWKTWWRSLKCDIS